MNRRGFLAALVGISAANKVFHSPPPPPRVGNPWEWFSFSHHWRVIRTPTQAEIEILQSRIIPVVNKVYRESTDLAFIDRLRRG